MDARTPAMPPITVVIADHKRARRAACLRLLELTRGIRVVGEAHTEMDAIAALWLRPRILLLDLTLSRDAALLLPLIRLRSPQTRVILFTEGASERRVLDALAYGASGYLEKKLVHAFLAKAVRQVDAGEAWVPRRMVSKVVERLRALRPEGVPAQASSRPDL